MRLSSTETLESSLASSTSFKGDKFITAVSVSVSISVETVPSQTLDLPTSTSALSPSLNGTAGKLPAGVIPGAVLGGTACILAIIIGFALYRRRSLRGLRPMPYHISPTASDHVNEKHRRGMCADPQESAQQWRQSPVSSPEEDRPQRESQRPSIIDRNIRTVVVRDVDRTELGLRAASEEAAPPHYTEL
ncbi:hypothetical protein VNI00_018165 [Paramarasmius palmivorus]|uniref:Uncharacterized protein n=1 Tax=Paramarasmius palmivorus TaxID=297713 RepID=A0AAW0B321_9AGAR